LVTDRQIGFVVTVRGRAVVRAAREMSGQRGDGSTGHAWLWQRSKPSAPVLR